MSGKIPIPRIQIMAHDSGMDSLDTQTPKPAWSALQRPTDNRLLGGVCAGIADQLGIDPVIVRVVIAVLAIIGPAGWILYGAGWLFVPAADQEHSPAARTFGVERHEPQLMFAGLITAGVLAAGWLLGAPFRWGSPFVWGWPWILLAAVVWITVIRPRARQREAPETDDTTRSVQTPLAQRTSQAGSGPTSRHSPALLAMTMLAVMIAMGVTWMWGQLRETVPLSTYLLIALAVVTVGVLVGTWIGDAGLLIVVGIMLAGALAVSLLPKPSVGDIHVTPRSAEQVASSYENGVGQLTLDLSRISDPGNLQGRTIEIRQGVGQTRVVVPNGVAVQANGYVDVGNTDLFGSQSAGTQVRASNDTRKAPDRAVTLKIHHAIGEIEVIRK